MFNNKGQAALYAMMLFLVVIILAVSVFGPLLKQTTQDGRDSMNCQNNNLTIGERSVCIAIDLINPYYIFTILIIGFSLLALGIKQTI